MNFLDLVIAMNIVDTSEILGTGYNALGLEGTGYITKVGSDVGYVKVGDRVVVCGTTSTGYATEVQRPTNYCIRAPEGLNDEDVAGMSLPYITVLWSFQDKANLRKG